MTPSGAHAHANGAFIALLTRDRSLMGEYATGRAWTVVIVAVTLMIAAATVVLGVVLVGG